MESLFDVKTTQASATTWRLHNLIFSTKMLAQLEQRRRCTRRIAGQGTHNSHWCKDKVQVAIGDFLTSNHTYLWNSGQYAKFDWNSISQSFWFLVVFDSSAIETNIIYSTTTTLLLLHIWIILEVFFFFILILLLSTLPLFFLCCPHYLHFNLLRLLK